MAAAPAPKQRSARRRGEGSCNVHTWCCACIGCMRLMLFLAEGTTLHRYDACYLCGQLSSARHIVGVVCD